MTWTGNPQKRLPFSCSRCGKQFASREAIRNHAAQCEEQEQPLPAGRPGREHPH